VRQKKKGVCLFKSVQTDKTAVWVKDRREQDVFWSGERKKTSVKKRRKEERKKENRPLHPNDLEADQVDRVKTKVAPVTKDV